MFRLFIAVSTVYISEGDTADSMESNEASEQADGSSLDASASNEATDEQAEPAEDDLKDNPDSLGDSNTSLSSNRQIAADIPDSFQVLTGQNFNVR